MAGTAGVIWILLSTSFIVFAGQAQGFGLTGALGIVLLFGLILNFSVFFLVVARIYRFLRKSAPIAGSTWVILICLVFGDSLFLLGRQIERREVDETMARGDQIITLVEEFKKRTGKLPEDLAEVPTFGIPLPSPTLRNSSFMYWKKSDDEFRVSFASVAWLICEKEKTGTEWRCDD